MKKSHLLRLLYTVSVAGLLWTSGASPAFGQFQPFTQNRDKIKVDASGFPADIQKGFQLFRDKCNGCHGLDTSLKPSMPLGQWAFVVKRMQNMPSSRFNDQQAKTIVDFLNYDETHRKSLNKHTSQAVPLPAGTVSAGRQVYDVQGCEGCHAIAGRGGNGGPDLSDVGSRLSRDQLRQVIQDIKSGKRTTMPQLAGGTTDEQIKDLVDYLATLKGN